MKKIFHMSLDSPIPPLPLVFLSLAHTLFSGSQCQQITLISMATCCTHVCGENNPQVGGNWVGNWPPLTVSSGTFVGLWGTWAVKQVSLSAF